jgi:hypothetical protein
VRHLLDAGDAVTDPRALHAALVRGRLAVEKRWAEGVEREHEPAEEVLTDRLLGAAHPEVAYAWFNQRQEGLVGADWLWWFVDEIGEAFGLLVQAKKLVRVGEKWKVGIDYESSGELQIKRLLRTSDELDVPAAYVLYSGDSSYRVGLTCGFDHVDGCERCARSGVTILPALEAESLVGTWAAGADLYRSARPLEDLAALNTERVYDLNLKTVTPALKQFLLMPQTGSRSVARELFRQVSGLRSAQLSHAADAQVDVGSVDIGSVPIFAVLPADRGHMSRPYYPHVLQGLRTELPAEVVALFAGEPAAATLFEHLAGAALLRI